MKLSSMRFADDSRGLPFSKDPAVVKFDGSYWLYYSVPPFGDERIGDGWRIGIATSSDLENWHKVGEIEPQQECEKNGFCAPGATVLNGEIHLFYQTYGNGKSDAICLATSTDGLNFIRHPKNPIFSPTGDWNCGRAIDADVIAHENQLFLYVATRDPDYKIQMQTVATAPLSSDFGPSYWKQHGEDSILKPELPWEGDCIEAAAVVRHLGEFWMFYGGAYNCAPQQIGLAVSEDGLNWRRAIDHPFLANGEPSSWNQSESGHPFVFKDGETIHLFFQGTADKGKTWFLSKATLEVSDWPAL